MNRLMTVVAAAGMLLLGSGALLAQENERPRRGPGPRRGPPPRREAGKSDRPAPARELADLPPAVKERIAKLSPEKRKAVMERIRRMNPEQRRAALRRFMGAPDRDGPKAQRRPDARARQRGARPDARRRGPAAGQDLRRLFARMDPQKRNRLLQRLRNARPEDRAAFFRKLQKRGGGADARRGGSRRGRFQGRSHGGRCPHCGSQARRDRGRRGDSMWRRGSRMRRGGGHPFMRRMMLRRMMMRKKMMRRHGMRGMFQRRHGGFERRGGWHRGAPMGFGRGRGPWV